MMVVLAGAALWPIVAPLVGTGTVAAMMGGGIGLLRGPGQEFVSDFLKRLAVRGGGDDDEAPLEASEVQADLELALRERLQADGDEAAALREDLSRLLRSVGGVESALVVASGEVKDALARGLAELSGTWQEFRWLLGQVEDRLHEIQRRQAEGLALQREGLDLQREQLVKTTLLLQLQGSPVRAPPQDDGVVPPPADVVCPYKGLQAFQPEDAAFFFGREGLVADVLARLAEARFVAVVGASGSGKSSFVRAGLVAAIWRGALPGAPNARVITLTPGERPLEQLAMRLALLRSVAAGSLLADLRADPSRVELAARQALIDAPPHARLVLVVDQFEELFTLCRDEAERRSFIEALLHAQRAVTSPTLVVLAVRADFYGRFAGFPGLAAAVQEHQALVGRMTPGDLRRAIEQPAAEAGLVLEPGLADTMLDDLGEEPGSLPLLSHALLETWKRRRGRTLTVAGYVESGGVRGAIAQTAERVVGGLDPSQRAIARRVFLDLTELGETSEPTRRPVSRNEVVPDSAAAGVIDVLADARLLTVGEDTVEVAHEALIRHWPTLRRWLEENRESLRLHRRLTHAAREWDALGRDPGALYRGVRLAAATDWAERQDAELSPLEHEFVHASRSAEESELQAARRRTRRLRGLALGLSALVLITAASALLALRESDRARTQQRLALSRSLATQALATRDRDVELAALLALESYHASRTIEARNAALTMLWPLERAAGTLNGPAHVDQVAFSPDGKILASGNADGSVLLWDLGARRARGQPPTRHAIGAPDDPSLGSRPFALSPDGKTLATGGEDKVRLWDVATRRELDRSLKGDTDSVTSVAFSPDGQTLATGRRGVVRLWDVATRRAPDRPLKGRADDVSSLVFSPDGKTLATGGTDTAIVEPVVQLWDVATRRALEPPIKGYDRVAFSRDGKTLATGGEENVRLWPLGPRRALGRPLKVYAGRVTSVAVSRDGKILATGGRDKVRLWDVATRRALGRPLKCHTDLVTSVAFSPDGKTLATAGDHARLWDITSRLALDQPLSARDSVTSLAFSRDGKTLATGGEDDVRLWDVATRRPVGQPRKSRASFIDNVAISPDGSTLATGGDDVRLWPLSTRHARGQPLEAYAGSARHVSFSPDGKTLAIVGAMGDVLLSEVATPGAPAQLLKADDTSVAFSPDGKTIATGGEGVVRLWDLATRRALERPLKGDAGSIYSMAFSPDGETLAVGGDDLWLWDLSARPGLGQPLKGHVGSVDSVSFSPDGNTLATGGDDLRLWDVATRRALGQPIQGHQSVAFSPVGKTLASVGKDGIVRIWSSILWSDSGTTLEAHLCESVMRSLTRGEWEEFLPEERYRPTCPNA